MEFTLLGSAAIAVFGFWAMLRYEGKRGNAAGCAVDLWDSGLVSAFAGLFAGRIAAMVAAGVNPLTNPGQIILIRSGVSTTVTALVTLAVFAFLARRDLVAAADGISAAALAGLAGWHAGCVTTNSCLGTESTLPWALTLEGSDVTRHPVELYAAVLLLMAAIGIALWKQYGRPPMAGPAGVALATAGGVRLVTEPMRISLAGGPVVLYAAGLVVGLGVVIGAYVRRATTAKRADPDAP